MSKIVYILRGIPGAGKSTLANLLNHSKLGLNFEVLISEICEADQYFTDDNDENYEFDISKLHQAHKYCQDKFLQAIKDQIDKIIVSNTSTTHKEYKFYKEEAIKAGYEVQVIIVGEFTDEAVERYARRNIHQVPIETIRKMRDRFQL